LSVRCRHRQGRGERATAIKPSPHPIAQSSETKIPTHTTANWSQSASGVTHEISLNDNSGIIPNKHTTLLLPSHPTIMGIGVSVHQRTRWLTSIHHAWVVSDFVVLVLFGFVAYRWVASRCSIPLPPGLKGLSVLGNSDRIPARKQWLKFHESIPYVVSSSARFVSLRSVPKRSRLYQHSRSTDADRWLNRSCR